MTLTPEDPAQQADPGPGGIISILWESVWEAFTNAILVTIFGSMILGLVGGLWEEMAPSMPPGFAGESHPHSHGEGFRVWAHMRPSFEEHSFLLIFGVMYVLTCAARILGRGAGGAGNRSAWSRLVVKRLSKEWFNLIVGNAFGAMVSAMVVVWSQEFSWTQWLWRELFGGIVAWLQHMAALVIGSERAGNIQAWIDWYGENQFKFTFWFLYLAAIGDDLGIPNFKTLGRWLWRKLRNRQLPAQNPAPPMTS